MNRHRIATTREVKAFWEANPVASAAIPHSAGAPEYFAHYDRLRETNETLKFSYELHEYLRFAGKRTLDLGCGNGYVASRYATEGAEAYGIDISRRAVELSRARVRQMRVPATFLVASAEDLPFRDATFDCVTSMGVLHHVANTPR